MSVSTLAPEVPRNRWGQPMIVPPGGGKPVAYARASSFTDVLEDRSNLEKWKVRMAVKGLALRPDLLLAATVTSLDERGELNKISEQAIEAAGGGSAASIGTSLHSLTEMLDRGHIPPIVPPQYDAVLAAYMAATKPFTMDHIERFMVCDDLRIAGTPDRVMGGMIGDLKTGGSDAKYLGKHAGQLAIYAHSQFYDPATGERTPIDNVNQEHGVIFHAPAGQGRCDLYEVNLVLGWEAVLLAVKVREWRKTKGLIEPYSLA
jgi:hypothetical protein